MARWRFLIDRGGTFTDCIGMAADGQLRVVKVLSSDQAPLIGIRQILGLSPRAAIPPCEIRMGTTVATNALLERKGVPNLLLTSTGFGDILDIGTQARPELFALDIQKPGVLYERVLEVDARAAPNGDILARPNAELVLGELNTIRESGIKSVAIVVLHGYAAPELELELANLANSAGFEHVSTSHELAAEIGLLRRASTTVLDAYLTPLLVEYLANLAKELPGSTLELMQSSGELTTAAHFRGPAALMSGPAGGVIACAQVARAAGHASAIGFDMGGTSTDVSRFSGEFERTYESTVAGIPVMSPMLAIHTVAAGGGSICRYDGHSLHVGPQSAGSDPGPLCYGNPEASNLTITDVNLLLGRLHPGSFPFPVDDSAPKRALSALLTQVNARNESFSRDALAEGFVRIANTSMADAIRRVSLERGYDVRRDALVVFGGAGGQHACAVARELGMATILFHPLAGVLSAYGMGLASHGFRAERDAGRVPLSRDSLVRAKRLLGELSHNGERQFRRPTTQRNSDLQIEHKVDLRYQGTETVLTLDLAELTTLEAQFHAEHRRLFGYNRVDHVIELVSVRAAVLLRPVEPIAERTVRLEPASTSAPPPEPQGTARVWCDGWHDRVPLYARETLLPGMQLVGPACVLETTGTIVIDPGFHALVANHGIIRVTRDAVQPSKDPPRTPGVPKEKQVVDPVMLQLAGSAFMSVATQMGTVLKRTALSTNIRERLDFSCAVFDRDARLIANAPHIPVHLGAMSESVRDIAEQHPHLQPGDVYLTNDPAHGGSHLPDVTAVTPVFDDDERLTFYVASRGHHADVGGISPGSMPPFSENLEEEGVVMRGLPLVRAGKIQHESIRRALLSGRYPARSPDENLADLEAQVAANRLGNTKLQALLRHWGRPTLLQYVDHLSDYAASTVAASLAKLAEGTRSFTDTLDDGTEVGVQLELQRGRLTITLSNTAAHLGNSNAPRAVSVAAALYVLRCLDNAQVPLNSGSLRMVEIVTPPGSLFDPPNNAAVVSGNVETSQRIVDVLLGALGQLAASQGTMNNLSFGNSTFGYYETIGGGAGAGPGFAGASGVHVHMTNTRITDPEVLESRFPVCLRQFSIRRGSGGAGEFAGGDGLVREIQFQKALAVSLLCERRTTAPFGLKGGKPGKPGLNVLNGQVLPGRTSFDAAPGDILRIETPGGGGYGSPP